MREAATINRIVATAKVVPILVFIALALFLLDPQVFADNFRGEGDMGHCSSRCIYTAFLLFAAGPKFILVSLIIYAPAGVLFVMARREQGRRLFSPGELVILAVSVVGAGLGIVALATGWVTI